MKAHCWLCWLPTAVSPICSVTMGPRKGTKAISKFPKNPRSSDAGRDSCRSPGGSRQGDGKPSGSSEFSLGSVTVSASWRLLSVWVSR